MDIGNYNRINPPKKSVGDYLRTLSTDDLQNIYASSSLYDLKMPELIRKLKGELKRRQN